MDAPHGSPDEVTDADLAALARDWIALVETELGAWLSDQEAQETWTALLTLWSRGFGAAVQRGAEAGAGGSAAGSAAAGAAPDAGSIEYLVLAGRIAVLESRVAELEGQRQQKRAPAKSKSRSRPKSS